MPLLQCLCMILGTVSQEPIQSGANSNFSWIYALTLSIYLAKRNKNALFIISSVYCTIEISPKSVLIVCAFLYKNSTLSKFAVGGRQFSFLLISLPLLQILIPQVERSHFIVSYSYALRKLSTVAVRLTVPPFFNMAYESSLKQRKYVRKECSVAKVIFSSSREKHAVCFCFRANKIPYSLSSTSAITSYLSSKSFICIFARLFPSCNALWISIFAQGVCPLFSYPQINL